MHVVEVSTNGTAVGTISYLGIERVPGGPAETRRFKCSPKKCVPKSVVKRIADSLSGGSSAGHEDVYDWRA